MPESQGKWIGWATKVLSADERYEFRLKLRRDGLTRFDKSNPGTQAMIVGNIDRNDAAASSLISGTLYTSPMVVIYMVITMVWISFMVVLSSRITDLQTGCIAVVIPVYTSMAAWIGWGDRERTIQRLEQALQASYRTQKKKAEYA